MGSGAEALRQAITGPNMRRLMGIGDTGELRVAKVENVDGGAVVNSEGDKDVLVHYTDVLTGHPGVAVLHIPGNVLFALPRTGETVLIARAGEIGGPGAAYCFLGDAGDAARVPSWALGDVPKDGISTDRGAVIQSKKDIELIADESGKKITCKAGNTTLTLNTDGSVVANANGTTFTMLNNGKVTVDAGSNDVELKGGKIKMKDGGTKVAKVGTKTTDHDHGGTGQTAGPYPVSGNTQKSQPVIIDDNAADDILVP